jgi:short-subunit dehydrogenase
MLNNYYTVITGASLGFGRTLALECAYRKMNLILVALPGEGLHNLADSIKNTYLIDAIPLEIDLSDDHGCHRLYHEVVTRGLEVNMLINNAGVGSTEFFSKGNIKQYQQQIKLNVLATTMITHLFLEMLKKNAPSYVMNVGSLASFFSLPKKQVYGATKSYIFYFSKSLRKEVKKENVFVSIVCPGGMYTNTIIRQLIESGSYLSRLSSMSPKDVAPVALNGLLKKKAVIIPGKINKTLVFLNTCLPRFVVNFLEARAMQKIHTPYTIMDNKKSNQIPVYALPLGIKKNYVNK